MKTIIVTLLLFIASASHAADDWSNTDIALQTAFTALAIVDWGQTLDIADNPKKFHETNIILGKHPSRGEVNAYFATAIVGHAIVSHFLPSDYRKIWQSVFIGVEAGCTAMNYRAGIRIGF